MRYDGLTIVKLDWQCKLDSNELYRLMQSSILLMALSVLSLLATPTDLCADDVELTASVNRNEVQIADPFELEIRLFAPQEANVAFGKFDDPSGSFEVLNSTLKAGLPTANQSPDQRLWLQTLTLETIQTGQLQIPGLEVVVQLPGQPNRVERTQPIAVSVASVIEPAADLTRFKDIADVLDVELPASKTFSWTWLGAGALTLLVVFSGAMLVLTRKDKRIASLAWALQRLSSADGLPDAESTVRSYIEERFGLTATSLPVDEVVFGLRKQGIEESLLQELSELSGQAEKVKFGGLHLPKTEEARFVNLAGKLVEQLEEQLSRRHSQ